MKKLKKVALVALSASMAAAMSGVSAQSGGSSNIVDASGNVWRNGTNELCWRDNSWTPASADKRCDGAVKSAPAAAEAKPAAAAGGQGAAPAAPSVPAVTVAPPVPAAVVAPVAPAVAAAPAPAPVAAVPTSEKVSYAADAFYDFDKATLKKEGQAKLDDMASKLSGMTLEVIVATGYTDSVGREDYNKKLSLRRAEAVKAYLVSKGIDASRIFTEGKGSANPVADNKTASGRAKNRRVEIEVVGTRAKK
jgi:OOP family OmpA-OmpF porin